MVFRRTVWIAVIVAGIACPGWAAEPAKSEAPAEPAKKAAAPDELPTRIIKVLRTTNKAQTNRYVPKVYTINNVNPYALFRWVRRTAQIEDGAYFFFGKPDEKGNVNSGKIVVTLPEYMLPGVDEMMKIIDRPNMTSGGGDVWLYLRPKHRSVADTGFTNMIQTVRGTSGDVVVDTEVNMVLVYAAASKTDDIKAILPAFDVPPPQVMVEVTVYEIFVDNESKLGLDYVSWKNGPGRNLFATGLFYEREKILSQDGVNALINTGTGGTYGLPGHQFRSKGANIVAFLDVPSAFLDYLVVKDKARVMTSAKIAARNLIASSLSAGDTILYYKTQVGTATNAGIRPEGVPADPTGASSALPDNRTVVGTQTTRLLGAKSGVTLQVTPTISENEMNLRIVTSVVSHTGFDDKGTPLLVSRTSDTEVRARDGQEIILGGYARESFVQRADKMPVLGSLPLIGYLFGGDANTTRRTQVITVLTPHVITDFSAMEYKGTKIDAALIQSRAGRKAPVEVPKTEVGFDQWLLDSER